MQVDLYCIESRRDWSNRWGQRQSRTGGGSATISVFLGSTETDFG